ncbi:MAG: hypothetical protein JNL18_03980, partial [Planctomycetaceae bacterium]|nr:hypothetical protein [Planctomycetaceae bacterium]
MRKAVQLGLVAAMFACFSVGPRAALAQISGPWPPQFGAYFWQGNNRGDGDGNTGVWNNWDGRWQIDSPPPPVVITTLAAQDGDTLILDDTFVNDEDRHSVSFGGHSLPSSAMQVHLNAAYSGGSLAFNSLLFQNSSNVHGPLAPYPIDVSGTTIDVDSLQVTALSDAITFAGATIDGNSVWFSGNESAGFPLPVGQRVMIKVNGGSVDADYFKMTGNFVAEADGAALSALVAQIGFADTPGAAAPELHLKGQAEFTVGNDLVVGFSGHGQIDMAEGSQLHGDNMNALVGLDGVGFVHASGESTIDLHHLEIGVRAAGFVFLDTGAAMTTDGAKLGLVVGFDGTANLENGGIWTTDDLTLGLSGNGYVDVRSNSTLTINGAGVLGQDPLGRGVVNMYGADSHLVLGEQGTLEIGH